MGLMQEKKKLQEHELKLLNPGPLVSHGKKIVPDDAIVVALLDGKKKKAVA